MTPMKQGPCLWMNFVYTSRYIYVHRHHHTSFTVGEVETPRRCPPVTVITVKVCRHQGTSFTIQSIQTPLYFRIDTDLKALLIFVLGRYRCLTPVYSFTSTCTVISTLRLTLKACWHQYTSFTTQSKVRWHQETLFTTDSKRAGINTLCFTISVQA